MNQPLSIFLPDQVATETLGAALAVVCATPGLTIYLDGDLGAGKTTLVRGMLRALGDDGPVTSPTYTLIELHAISGLDLYHFDFYRFSQPEEYLDAGLDEYFTGRAVCLVEWPGRAAPYLPAADLRVRLSVCDQGRDATVEAHSDRGRQCLTNFVLPAVTSLGSPPPA
jgi:tRNA threonylcarbamoyladenosine biosynthesis protein TsaE